MRKKRSHTLTGEASNTLNRTNLVPCSLAFLPQNSGRRSTWYEAENEPNIVEHV